MSFKRLDAEDFVVSADQIQGIAWSTGLPTLSSFFTSSAQAVGTSGNYYLSVYQVAGNLDEAEVQFDIAYGNKYGSGSTPFNALYPDRTPSSVIYGQYRSMILEDENAVFLTGIGTTGQTSLCGTITTSSTAVEMDDFWVISPDRARYKQQLFPGTFEILLSGFAGKFIEIAIDTYLNSDGIILLLEKSQKKNEIPKPSFITFIGCPLIMHNNGINSFYINYEIEGKKYPIYFLRNGIKWKIIKIEFPKKLFEKMK